MNKERVIDAYSKLNNSVMEFGTERTGRVLKRLSEPDGKLKIIHIAGTNGKGSVAEYITRILVADGKKVGTFTSPEVYSFCDQFRIDGEPVAEEELENCLGYVKSISADIGATPFETETAAALKLFADKGCEYAAIECGLGGRYDATNAVSHKELAVITSISYEHTAVLGNTLREICFHKAGIIVNCSAIVSALQPKEAAEYFSSLGARFADKPISVTESGLGGQIFNYGDDQFRLAVPGFAQPYNAAVAIEAARMLGLGENAIRIGLAAAAPSGRLEVIKRDGGVYILDGGHNPAGIAPLARLIRDDFGRVDNLIFGCLNDKDIGGILDKLEGLADRVWAVSPASIRAMPLGKIAEECGRYFKNVTPLPNVGQALERSRGSTVVCGSFTLLKEAKEWIEKKL